MKKNIFTSLVLAFAVSAFSQEVIQNFNPEEITPIAESYPDGSGYMTGHNDYGDEEFAEKYIIEGNGTVHGIIAIHTGEEGTSTLNASYRIYNVAASGYPNSPLANKNIPYNDIPVDENPFTVNFDNPIEVSGEFFASFRLGDYVHGNLGTKLIAITHAPDGTREESDFEIFGRNVIRWHSHGATVWKDYRTENFSDYNPAIHFSLFPLIELESMSNVDLHGKGKIGSVYPNPSFDGEFNVQISSNSAGNALFQLYDLTGKLIKEKNFEVNSIQNNYKFSSGQTVSGIYVLIITTPEGKIAQRVVIK